MELENRVLDIALGVLLYCLIWVYADVGMLSELLIDRAVQLAEFLDETILWLGTEFFYFYWRLGCFCWLNGE